MESTAPVVRDPAPDRPALADPTTAIILRLRADQSTGLAVVAVLLAFCLTSALLVAAVGVSEYVIGHFAAALSLVFALWAKHHLWGRWLRPARGPRLVHDRPWRALPALVVRGRTRQWASVVQVEEDGVRTAVRVTALSRAHRAVLARTGRAWVVGPDEAGWAALRVDGTHEALPAKALHRVPAAKPEPAFAPPEVCAARELRADLLFAAWFLLAGYLFVGVMSLGVDYAVGKALLVGLGALTLVALLITPALWHLRVNLRLPALVAGARWQRVELSLAPWKARADGTARAAATVHGGGDARLRLPAASVELLGTIWDTGAAWVSGELAAGAWVAVGHPGYGPVAVARVERVEVSERVQDRP
ncbi:hypothetical protein [Actinokineospora bangkokensis]|uniref:Uncharacterized protein n=1 Tax=Actinokineospora bangkokensis TaxID=1193682 RepID=A0A1Q9LT74_9PSEU|nr:hypothetical protein [Actinokineospora bangkokensis]OLR95247.1 hypothetical protein BJP25_07095 [Actinokineospora bangkokensis]